MITEQHKKEVVGGLASQLEKKARDAKGQFPVPVNEIVESTVGVLGIEKFNRMLSMCTVGLELVISEGKYFLTKKR